MSKVKVVRGTANFVTFQDAVKHYRPYLGEPQQIGGEPGYPKGSRKNKWKKDEECEKWVRSKIDSGEIHVGKPVLNKGEVLVVKDGQYHIAIPV